MNEAFPSDGSAGQGDGSGRSRARSFEITDAADRMMRQFKDVGGVNYRVQVERTLKFVSDRGRANSDQFFNLVMHAHFTEYEARQMIELLAAEFQLSVHIAPRDTHA